MSFELRLQKIFLKYWRRNYGSTRSPVWKNLCTFYCSRRGRNFDLHYLNPNSTSDGLDDVAFYVSKYCLKFDKWVDKFKSKVFFNTSEQEYQEFCSFFLPKRLISKGFGSPNDPRVLEHLNKGINFSLADPSAMFPYFISPVNGSTFPLSPYYAKKLLTFADMDVFNSRKPLLTDYDSMMDSSNDLLLEEVLSKELHFQDIRDWLDSKHTLEDDSANFINDFILINNETNPNFSACFDDFDSSDFLSGPDESSCDADPQILC